MFILTACAATTVFFVDDPTRSVLTCVLSIVIIGVGAYRARRRTRTPRGRRARKPHGDDSDSDDEVPLPSVRVDSVQQRRSMGVDDC